MAQSNSNSTSSPTVAPDAQSAPHVPVSGSVPLARSRGQVLPIDHGPAVPAPEQRRSAHPDGPPAMPSDEPVTVRAVGPRPPTPASSIATAQVGDYDVGYKKPPKDSQFKKGKSGNPKGRVKGSRNLATIVEDIAGEQIAVRENGRTRKMSKLEIVIKKLVSDALQGNPKATAQLMRILKDLGQFENPAKSEARLAAEREEGLSAFQQDILDDFVVQRFAELRPSSLVASTPPVSSTETMDELTDSEACEDTGLAEGNDEFEDDHPEPLEHTRQTITLDQHIRKYGEPQPRSFRAIKDD